MLRVKNDIGNGFYHYKQQKCKDSVRRLIYTIAFLTLRNKSYKYINSCVNQQR